MLKTASIHRNDPIDFVFPHDLLPRNPAWKPVCASCGYVGNVGAYGGESVCLACYLSDGTRMANDPRAYSHGFKAAVKGHRLYTELSIRCDASSADW